MLKSLFEEVCEGKVLQNDDELLQFYESNVLKKVFLTKKNSFINWTTNQIAVFGKHAPSVIRRPALIVKLILMMKVLMMLRREYSNQTLIAMSNSQ